MIFAIRRKLAIAFRSWQAGGFPSHFVTTAPDVQSAVDIFKGEWASKIPVKGIESGSAPLFADERLVNLFGSEGIEGKDVLELGPLEGGHSYMLDAKGAHSVVAVEANARAFLKCLLVKEILGLKSVKFLLGDIYEYLKTDSKTYDLVLSFGVLYHLRDPQKMFELLGPRVKTGGRLFLWTHFWRETIESECITLKGHFTAIREAKLPDGKSVTLHRHEYGSSIFNKGFFGGNAPYSEWMTRQGILDAAKVNGFVPEIDNDLNHDNGPSLLTSFRKI